MNPYIRVFTPDDYEAMSAINNAIRPDYPFTPVEMRHWDEHREPKCKWQRYMAECDGQVVGYAHYNHFVWMYHPRKFGIYAAAHPEYQGRGIGTALYNHVLAELDSFEPLTLRAEAREDEARSVRFLINRGFKEEIRVWESRLDVNAFDPSPYAGIEERMREREIEIKTLRELESDPDRNRKLYDLMMEVDLDAPSPEPVTLPSFENFVENRLKDPNLLPDAFFIALHHGEYVGTSALWKRQADNNLWTGLTGTRREYRRQGIALALKLRAIDYARRHGHPMIGTENDSTNRPMLSINERLGFVRQPAWINYVKVLREA